MTYEEALQFWFGRVNYEQRSPKPSDLKLDRMRALLERLDNPQRRLRCVHIAGSKGKGSTAAMLAAILQQSGYRTGLFTSPHLCRVEERIQIDGQPISGTDLAALMTHIAPAVAAMDDRAADQQGVTFFEIGTALGFLHFVQQRIEMAVLEVGLGGRFDSTNVCEPLLAIITSISYDHMRQLGNTLASIAREKAGIIKPGRPTISGVRAPEARPVIERISQEQHSRLRQLDADFHYRYTPGCLSAGEMQLPQVLVQTEQRRWPVLPLNLLGDHQAANAAVVVAAVEELQQAGLPIPAEAVRQGLQQVYWPARLEVIQRRPLVVLDCAHNRASAQALVDTLQTTFPAGTPDSLSSNGTAAPSRNSVIFASSQDKDIRGMLEVLSTHFDHFYLTRFANNPRCTPPEQLAQILQRVSDRPYTLCTSAAEAWRQASSQATPQDLLCITGSVFLAGEMRPLL